MSIRDQILSSDDRPSVKVHVPEWGVDVDVRGMSAEERAVMYENVSDGEGEVNTRTLFPAIVVNTAYDPETGKPVFTPDDVEALLSKSGAAIQRVAEVGMRLSGMGDTESEVGKGSTQDTPASTGS